MQSPKYVYLIILLFGYFFVGCNGEKPTTPTTPTPTASLPKALQCIVDKKIKVSGTYRHPMVPDGVEVNREAEISASLFKIKTTGTDELAERDASDTKIETWEGDYVGLTPDGENGYGYNEETKEDCYKVQYKKGPFDGPGGRCVMEMTGRICEDTCTVENGQWKLTCGVDAQGNGGEAKAFGNWTLEE